MQTLTDCFEISVPETSSIAQIRQKLTRERFGHPVDLVRADGDHKLSDAQLVAELPFDVKLLCVVVPKLRMLEESLGRLSSPGDSYQKYLRRFVDVHSSDPRVLQSIWGLAVLASTRASCNEWPEPHKQPVDQVAAAVVMLLDRIWCSSGQQCLDASVELLPECATTKDLANLLQDASLEDLQRLLTPHYREEAHEKLLSWILKKGTGDEYKEGESSGRLRVTLAEIDQILVRGASRFLTGIANDRQTEAYEELLTIAEAECDSEDLIHSRAFGGDHRV